MPATPARPLSSTRARMTYPPSRHRGLRGGRFVRSGAQIFVISGIKTRLLASAAEGQRICFCSPRDSAYASSLDEICFALFGDMRHAAETTPFVRRRLF